MLNGTAQTPQSLLGRAALLEALARGFAYPEKGFRDALAQGRYAEEIAEALDALDGSLSTSTAATRLHEALEETRAQADLLEGEYTYLFARNVVTPSNETSYGKDQGLQRARELSDIASFYAAFGFKIISGRNELPDHVGAELEFMAVLYAKETYARERGWAQPAELCAQAREKFLREHLGQWMPLLARQLDQKARLRFYPALAAMAHAVLSEEPAYAEVKPLDAKG